MKLTPYLLVLLACVSIVRSSIYAHVKDNVLNFIQRSIANYNDKYKGIDSSLTGPKNDDTKAARLKALVLKRAKVRTRDSKELLPDDEANGSRERYRIDPVLNFLTRKKGNELPPDVTTDTSSSVELQDWKDEWREQWIQKKFEAINTSHPIGDTVNMVAARPWGVPCGDPNQHDMPWGSCTLPMECDAEYRIYRGDYFCGRTQFVCCALQLTNYDMYQGFDVSFEDSEVATDTEEIRNRGIGSKERNKKHKKREKDRRRRVRKKRKREMKKNIKNIMREINKILNKVYRNGTTERKRKTKLLKKFVASLKKQYKKDRKAMQNIHEQELIKIDKLLQKKLNQIKGMNQDFIKNQTYRDIIVNGTASDNAIRMLVAAYPDLAGRLDATRRSNDARPGYLNYDIEYGLLYY